VKLFFPLVSVLWGLLAIQSCQLPTSIAATTSTYTVTYSANGAMGSAPTDSANYPQGSTVITRGAGSLSKAGYTFSGWNTLANGSGVAYSAGASFTMGTASVTLYAQWTANQNTISFNANGGTGTMASQTVATNATANLTANTFTKAGYAFAGWNTLANGTGAGYADKASYTMGTASVTLYAQWTANQNTISFNANGGTGTMASQTVATNATASLTGNAFTNAGYAFSGWNTLANGTGTGYADKASFTMGTASVILYAQWNPTYTVTYVDNGSSSGSVPVDSKNYQAGATVTVMGNAGSLAKTGYTFSGWNTLSDGSGTSYSSGTTFSMPASNTNLYALWSNSTTGTVTIQTPSTYLVTISGISTISVGIAANFTSTYTGSAVGYQWYLNGVAIPGATSSSLTYTQAAASAYYGINQLLLVVIDANGLWYSGGRQVTVTT